MKQKIKYGILVGFFFLVLTVVFAEEEDDDEISKIQSIRVSGISEDKLFDEKLWKDAKTIEVSLVGQPMALPKPTGTHTSQLNVQSIHDGKWIAFRLKWSDKDKSYGGVTGKFPDGVALQFPTKPGDPPAVFMGASKAPVHILHWTTDYQRDVEKGKPDIKDHYPNMPDHDHPFDYSKEVNEAVKKSGGKITDKNRDTYSGGIAAGNPRSSQKGAAVVELLSEGFGSSAFQKSDNVTGRGEWNKNQWDVVILRPLKSSIGLTLKAGSESHIAFAVWQGGKEEVGSRKSVTMMWTPFALEK